jgi:hypothetical protein
MQVNRAPPVSIGARLILVLERAFTDVRVRSHVTQHPQNTWAQIHDRCAASRIAGHVQRSSWYRACRKTMSSSWTR